MDPNQIITLVIGPAGALVILSVSVWSLWRVHVRDDARRDTHLERQLAINEQYADALPPLTEAVRDATSIMTKTRPR